MLAQSSLFWHAVRQVFPPGVHRYGAQDLGRSWQAPAWHTASVHSSPEHRGAPQAAPFRVAPQVPGVVATQLSQGPLHCLSQQTPSTQWPLRYAALFWPQRLPLSWGLEQTCPMQLKSETQSDPELQLDRQASASGVQV